MEYHGHEKIMNLLRGPGFTGTGRGGRKSFDWSSWNFPIPSYTTRKKNSGSYTTESGIHKHMLAAFMTLCSVRGTPVHHLVDTDSLCVIPVSLQRDGMQLKPGLVFDKRQGILIGTTENIDVKYVESHPVPEPEHLKNIMVKEADCCCISSLDGTLSMPIGVIYLPSKVSADETARDFIGKAKQIQTCLNCIVSGKITTKSGVIVGDACKSECVNCTQLESVCTLCEEKGQVFCDPQLRRCTQCVEDGVKCTRLYVLIVTMDSEAKNKSAGVQFETLKKNGTVDSLLSHMSYIPDGVHVSKRLARHFSNWYLLIDGYRVSRVMLRTLRNDPELKDHLRPILTLAACRNRDRMDTKSVVEISCVKVRATIQEKGGTATETLIPEKYRIYEANKPGTLVSPVALCLGPNSIMFMADVAQGKIFSAKLHYPVDISELCAGLSNPIALCYTNGMLLIAESGASVLKCVDFECRNVYNPESMTLKQLGKALRERGLWQPQLKKKNEMQLMLRNWLGSGTSGHEKSRSGKNVVPVKTDIKSPSALTQFDDDKVAIAWT